MAVMLASWVGTACLTSEEWGRAVPAPGLGCISGHLSGTTKCRVLLPGNFSGRKIALLKVRGYFRVQQSARKKYAALCWPGKVPGNITGLLFRPANFPSKSTRHFVGPEKCRVLYPGTFPDPQNALPRGLVVF